MTDEIASRREFCKTACGVITAAAWVGALSAITQGCGGGGAGTPSGPSGVANLPVINAQATGTAVALTIDASSPLNAVGSAVLVQSNRGPILVARTGADAFVAVSGVCTHESCTITGFASDTYVCPCHGSLFSTSGQVRQGPARQALRTLTTTFSNGSLTIAT